MRGFSLTLALLAATACSKSEAPAPPPAADPPPVQPAVPAPATAVEGDLGYGDDARLFASPAEAIRTLLAEQPESEQLRVIGFGEYHKLLDSAPVRSALRRFADEIFDVLGSKSAHLVLETWQVDPACGNEGNEVRKQVESAIERPPETESEMQVLLRKMQNAGTTPHVLHFSCKDYNSLLEDNSLNTESLLTLVNKKLEEQAKRALQTGPENKLVLIYGGATHNNLFPYAGLEHWSFGKAIDEATKGAYLEIDLYVPELVEGDALLSQEPWYPLLAEARNDQVILIRRDPASYILLMRKGYGDTAATTAN